MRALAWARSKRVPVALLGGGSNSLVPDQGIAGLVIHQTGGVVAVRQGADEQFEIQAQAGADWDSVVSEAVDLGLQGIECLSGIPGSVGATIVQNIGAYGQEIASVVRAVRLVELATGVPQVWSARDCEFGYRHSKLKRDPGRFAVTQITLQLQRRPGATTTYPEVAAELGTTPATVQAVREAVLSVRRRKSMTLDPADPNRRSVGSFFLNPVVAAAGEAATRAGITCPQWPVGPGRIKLSAAWLVERAGFAKGYRQGKFGISTAHALALVHHGGGNTDALLQFAERIANAVFERFGVRLEREPVLMAAVPLA